MAAIADDISLFEIKVPCLSCPRHLGLLADKGEHNLYAHYFLGLLEGFGCDVVEVLADDEMEKLVQGVAERLSLLLLAQELLEVVGLLFLDVDAQVHQDLDEFGEVGAEVMGLHNVIYILYTLMGFRLSITYLGWEEVWVFVANSPR